LLNKQEIFPGGWQKVLSTRRAQEILDGLTEYFFGWTPMMKYSCGMAEDFTRQAARKYLWVGLAQDFDELDTHKKSPGAPGTIFSGPPEEIPEWAGARIFRLGA
jgi:hypothetical protein